MKKKTAGRPIGREHDKALILRVSSRLIDSIDRWRDRQNGIWSRAEAVRRLIKIGIRR